MLGILTTKRSWDTNKHLGKKKISCRLESWTKLQGTLLSTRVAPSKTRQPTKFICKSKIKHKQTKLKFPTQFRLGFLPEGPLCPPSMSCSFHIPASREMVLTRKGLRSGTSVEGSHLSPPSQCWAWPFLLPDWITWRGLRGVDWVWRISEVQPVSAFVNLQAGC